MMLVYFFCKQKTAYEMRISDWSSDVCSSDLLLVGEAKIGDKAKGERVDYDIGSSPAVQVRVRILPDSDPKDYRQWEVTLTNARPFDAAIEMLIPFALDPAPRGWDRRGDAWVRSEEHTSELQSLMPLSYAVFCLK